MRERERVRESERERVSERERERVSEQDLKNVCKSNYIQQFNCCFHPFRGLPYKDFCMCDAISWVVEPKTVKYMLG